MGRGHQCPVMLLCVAFQLAQAGDFSAQWERLLTASFFQQRTLWGVVSRAIHPSVDRSSPPCLQNLAFTGLVSVFHRALQQSWLGALLGVPACSHRRHSPGGGGLGAGGTLENSSVQMINAPLCVQPGEPGSVGGGGRGVETPLAQLCISECLGMCGLWSLSSAKTAGDNEGWARVQGWLRTESCAVSKLASLRKSSAGAECSHPPNHLCHSPQP